MKAKQLTLKEILKGRDSVRCLKCSEKMDLSIKYYQRIPICKKCRTEVKEDLEESRN